MGSKYVTLNDRLYDYLIRSRSDADDALLAQLRAETTALGEVSVCQISDEQGAFLSVLVAAIGARTAITLDESVARIQGIREAALSVRSDILVLCHGGPIAEPDDVQYVLSHTHGISGFFGASSIERLPTERAITEQVSAFKKLNLHAPQGERSSHG